MNLHNEHYIFSYLQSVTKTESHFQRKILMQSLGESCSLCYAGYSVSWSGLLPFLMLEVSGGVCMQLCSGLQAGCNLP